MCSCTVSFTCSRCAGTPFDPATSRHALVGYFTDAAQTEPVYDPPHDAPCLVCWQPLHAEDVRTICLIPASGAKSSVFFRVHRTCAERDAAAVEEIEHRVIEGEWPLNG